MTFALEKAQGSAASDRSCFTVRLAKAVYWGLFL